VNQDVATSAMKLHPFVQDFRHEENPTARERRVAYLTENWDENLVGRLMVIPAQNGAMYVVDGGHRLTAARILHESGQRPNSYLPCAVIHGVGWDDRATLAELTLGFMDQRGWSAFNKFALRRDAGLSPQADIEGILNRHGTRAVPYSQGGYTCVQRLEEIYAAGNLEAVIHIIEDAWGEQIDARNALTVRALGFFVQAYGKHNNYDEAQFIDRLSRRSAHALLVDARASASATRTSVVRRLCQNLRDIYNSRRTNQLPEFRMPKAKF